MTQIKHKEGFLVVASMHQFYKNSAIQLIESLEDYYPEGKVMVACHEEWRQEFEQLDNVVHVITEGFPISIR